MLITQRALPHVRQLDGAFRAGVHEPVAADWVELCRGYDFSQLLHVRGFDIHDVEALILNVEVPQIDSEVIAADESLAVTVHGDAVDVVCVRVRIGLSRHGRHDRVMMSQSRELEIGSGSEMHVRISHRSAAASYAAAGSQLVR